MGEGDKNSLCHLARGSALLLKSRDRHSPLPDTKAPRAGLEKGLSGGLWSTNPPRNHPWKRLLSIHATRPRPAPPRGSPQTFPSLPQAPSHPPKMAAGASPPSPGPGAGTAELLGRAGPGRSPRPAPADVKHRPVPRPSPHCQRPHPPPEPRSPSRAAAAQARAGSEGSLAAPAAQVGRGGR